MRDVYREDGLNKDIIFLRGSNPSIAAIFFGISIRFAKLEYYINRR